MSITSDGGLLFHAWLEPPSAPHHGLAGGAGEMLAMHGPGDVGAVAVARVDGRLEWGRPSQCGVGAHAVPVPPVWDPPHR